MVDQNSLTVEERAAFEFASKVVELKAKYGEVYTLKRGGQSFVLRLPDDVEVRRVMMADKKTPWETQMLLVKHAVVYPEGAELDAVLTKYGALVPVLFDEAFKISALDDEAKAKKA